jgi:hypothetical protein
MTRPIRPKHVLARAERRQRIIDRADVALAALAGLAGGIALCLYLIWAIAAGGQ